MSCRILVSWGSWSISHSPYKSMFAVRLSAFDLVKVFIEDPNLADASYSSITFAVKKHLEENALNSSPHWWKVCA